MILVLLSSFNIPNRFFKILSTIFFIIVIFFLIFLISFIIFCSVSESFGVAGYSGIPACFGVLVLRYSGVFQCSGVFFSCVLLFQYFRVPAFRHVHTALID